MKITSRSHPDFSMLLVIVLSMSSIVSCTASVSAPTPTTAPTNTATTIPTKTLIPTATVTLTPKPLTATTTPTELELLEALNERTQLLFGEPASNVIDFFLKIQDYIRTDNKEKSASLVLYPITIHSIDGKDIEIKNEKEFIANYEKIATPKWKGVVLAQEPTKLFTNYEGVMVNRGELWFGPWCIEICANMKYYILNIVNDTPW